MEHPYLFLTSLFSLFGLEDWAGAHPHVTYMWLAMILLVIFGWIGGKGVALVPKTVQNVFEVIISGLEEFMVGITGEEGRESYPLLLTVFLFVLLGNLFWSGSRFLSAHSIHQHHSRIGCHRCCMEPCDRRQKTRCKIYQTFLGTCTGTYAAVPDH